MKGIDTLKQKFLNKNILRFHSEIKIMHGILTEWDSQLSCNRNKQHYGISFLVLLPSSEICSTNEAGFKKINSI